VDIVMRSPEVQLTNLTDDITRPEIVAEPIADDGPDENTRFKGLSPIITRTAVTSLPTRDDVVSDEQPEYSRARSVFASSAVETSQPATPVDVVMGDPVTNSLPGAHGPESFPEEPKAEDVEAEVCLSNMALAFADSQDASDVKDNLPGPPTTRSNNASSRSRALPDDKTPRITIAQRRAMNLPPTSTPIPSFNDSLSSPFDDGHIRRDSMPTQDSTADGDDAPYRPRSRRSGRGNRGEVNEEEGSEDEQARLDSLILAVQKAQRPDDDIKMEMVVEKVLSEAVPGAQDVRADVSAVQIDCCVLYDSRRDSQILWIRDHNEPPLPACAEEYA